ncbi:aromatic prenyltransferase [Hymenopellis radicata]|nr:aromatic prenyltransferase [Hymenopellis radicata]
MQNLTQDRTYFPQRAETKIASPRENSSLLEVVRYVVVALLGTSSLREAESEDLRTTGVSVFDVLTEVLPPMPARIAFHWNKLGKSFASMQETAAFTVEVQARFLIFVYARVLGLMGPAEKKGPGCIVTVDGSPVELSWVIPNRSKPRRGEATRQLRFAFEPLHPETGIPLKGAPILDYLTSPEGGLGVVSCPDQGMKWRKETENFLSPNDEGDEIPTGSRFFVGFDFNSSGTLTLKVYYNTAFYPPSGQLRITSTEPNVDAPDFKSLDKLLPHLHPTLIKPFETLRSYFDNLEESRRPLVGMLALDCVQPDTNRLKIYCHTMTGTSWADAKRSFTLGGALDGPNIDQAVQKLEILWNHMFPNATSAMNVGVVPTLNPDRVQPKEDDQPRQPDGGLLFYYELIAGESTVYPKIYVPVRTYCPNDLFVCNAIEKFYNDVGVEGSEVGEHGQGWVAREIAKAYNHRKLNASSGIHTHISIGAKKVGWELTSYLSPEVWL